MPADKHKKRNALSIRLTESAVFLRTDPATARRNPDSVRSSMLRGLLTLDLVKPTKISSIEIELTAKTATAWPEGTFDYDSWVEVTEEHRVFHASTVYFRAGKAGTRRTASLGPGIVYSGDEGLYDDDDFPSQSHTPRRLQEGPPNDDSPEEEPPRGRAPRPTRRVSIDSSTHYHRGTVSHVEHIDTIPTPPYSPFASPHWTPSDRNPLSPAASTIHLSSGSEAQLEESRHPASLHHVRQLSANSLSPAGSAHSLRLQDRSLSRRPSMEDVPEYGTVESGPSIPRQPHSHHSPTPSNATERGRAASHSRFSLSSVGNALLDVVRSSSPITGKFVRDRSVDYAGRGRTLERHDGTDSSASSLPRRNRESVVRESKERTPALAKVGEILRLDLDDKKEKEKDAGDGWKEFKKGTYTYPISFSIPGNSPPTLQCDYGSVNWRLRAVVHRPGAFKSKLVATREVIMIACPTEDDTEDTENIIVERHWDQQLQYLISISGRSFYIGGTIPITFTMLPLAKMKIHRISVYVEERGEGKGQDPILPLQSDDPEAFRHSPLHTVMNADDDISEMASSLMGPGPWTFHQELKLPASCQMLRFTNKNRRSNIVITHLLKCVMRVERGDDLHVDAKTGKRKLFDIVVQTPVQILSCRCNPEWTSLPRYSETLDDPLAVGTSCPCQVRKAAMHAEHHFGLRPHLPAPLERMTSRHSSDSSASNADTSPVNPVLMRSLRHHDNFVGASSQFERLISGQETELGEAPPAYEAVAVAIAI
ncbi:hypothetical protein BDQ17DRAFT_1344100 [Cyathus striatus]|nr:hypothetical protein BDQ17DRAFT_1344100 [Cyathus striatus]